MKIHQNVLILDPLTLLKFCHGLPGKIQRARKEHSSTGRTLKEVRLNTHYAFLCQRLDLKRNSSQLIDRWMLQKT